MNVSHLDDEIIFHVDSASKGASLERAYLKRFDGATVRFVSNEEGDRLVIDRSPQTPGGNSR